MHIEDLSVEIRAQELQRLIDRFLSVSASSLYRVDDRAQPDRTEEVTWLPYS